MLCHASLGIDEWHLVSATHLSKDYLEGLN